MRPLSVTVRSLALGLGALGAVVGVTVYGVEGGVLWSLVGYFLGKAIQSTFWTIAGNHST
ncbi:hypothetical protein [Halomontanus rarus]|uniref:hypothetical protein n=1 Tax=Halomontanus rarus TaxID=3034020 RepID=UPI001A982F18